MILRTSPVFKFLTGPDLVRSANQTEYRSPGRKTFRFIDPWLGLAYGTRVMLAQLSWVVLVPKISTTNDRPSPRGSIVKTAPDFDLVTKMAKSSRF